MKPRMPRADLSGFDGHQSVFKERLNSAVTAHPHHVVWHRDEHRSKTIEPLPELDRSLIWPGPKMWDDVAFRKDPEAWKKGLEFGGHNEQAYANTMGGKFSYMRET